MRVFVSFFLPAAMLWLAGCAAVVSNSSASKPQPSKPSPTPAAISVAITDKFASQVTGGPTVTLNATVSNDSSNAGVTWTLTAGGVSCTPGCGSLSPSASPSFSAIYTPPSTLPASPSNSPTITATSVAEISASDSFTFSLSFSSGAFVGNYVYLLRGYNATGQPTAIAGVIDLDTQGNVIGGQLDANVAGQITTSSSPLVGNYVVDTSFNGVTRGTINITNFTVPGTTTPFGMKCALSADGTRGKVIEYDGSGFLMAGTFLLQNSAAASGQAPTGNFAFGLDSDSPIGARVVEAGQFSLGSGAVTGGLADQSQADGPAPIYSAAAITSGSVTPPDSVGRGTLSFNVAGSSVEYAYYLVNSGQLDLIEIDSGGTLGTVQAGTALLQNALTPTSPNATSVLQMTGIDQSVATQTLGPAVVIGVMSTSGSSFNLTFDSNDVGTVLTTHPASGQIVSFDSSTGRGIISVTNGAQDGFLNTAVFYLFNTGTGFLIDADPTTTGGTPLSQVVNKAYSGTFSLQIAGSLSDQNLSGNTISITGASAIPAIPDIVLAANFNPSGGSFSAIADVASLPSQIGNSPNRTFSDDYQLTDTTLGHGNLVLPPGFFNEFDLDQPAPATFYLIGPNQFVLIGTLSGADSGVTFFDPQ